MLNLIAAAAVVLAALGIGVRVLRRWQQGSIDEWERAAFSIGLGLGMVSLTVLVLGSMRLAYPATGYAIIGASLLVGWRELYGIIRSLIRKTFGFARSVPGMGIAEKVLLAYLILAAVVNLVAALAPPSGSDEMIYHFALPKLFLQSHETGYIPSNRYCMVPLGMEMIWLLSMMLFSATAAQVVNWAIGLTLGLVIYGVGKRYAGQREALLAVALYYSITAVAYLSASGKPEMGGALFLTLSVVALMKWCEQRTWPSLVLAGVFAGFFASTKLPNLLVVCFLGLVVILCSQKGSPFLRKIYRGAVFMVIATVLVGVWFLRSWLLTGNPVYPYLPTVFGGRDLINIRATVQASKGEANAITSMGDPILTPKAFLKIRSPLEFVASPWLLSTGGKRLHAKLGDYRGFPGPMFLIFLPVVLLGFRRFPPAIRFLLVTLLFLYAGWFLSYSMLRNLIAVLALLSVPTAIVFVRTCQDMPVGRWVIIASFGGWLAFSFASAVVDARRAVPAVSGAMTKENWLAWRLALPDRRMPIYPAYRYMNAHLPDHSKVLLWETCGFYLDRPYLRCWEFMYGLADGAKLRSETQVLGELQRHGITHVAFSHDPFQLWLRTAIEQTGPLERLYEDDRITVCRLPWAEKETEVRH